MQNSWLKILLIFLIKKVKINSIDLFSNSKTPSFSSCLIIKRSTFLDGSSMDSFHGGIRTEGLPSIRLLDALLVRPSFAFENEATGFRCPRVGSNRHAQPERKGRHKGETQSFNSFSVFKVSPS